MLEIALLSGFRGAFCQGIYFTKRGFSMFDEKEDLTKDGLEMKKCPKCGSTVQKNCRFCPNCSAEISTEKKKMKKSIKIVIAVSASAVAIGGLTAASILCFIPMYKYNEAEKSLSNKEYQTAIYQFTDLGSYSDSQQRIVDVYECIAYDMLETKTYEEVNERFNSDIVYSYYSYVVDSAVYKKATDAFANCDYEKSRFFYSMIPDYQNSSEMISESFYLEGLSYMESGDYDTAIESFSNLSEYKDVDEKNKEAYYCNAEKLYKSGDKLGAAEAYAKSGQDYKDADQRMFEIGEELLSEGKYDDANKAFAKASNGYEYSNYAAAMNKMEKEDYSGAIESFKMSSGVLDTDEKLKEAEQLNIEKRNRESFEKAEEYYKKGELIQAQNLFKHLPSDYSYKGISVKERLDTLDKYSDFVDICGYWYSSVTNRFKTSNVANRSGSSESWYMDDDGNKTYNNKHDVYLEIQCIIQSDGKVRIKGKGGYWRCTNYSMLSSLLKTEHKIFTFEKTVTSVFSTIDVDSDTTLSYNGKSFALNYWKKETYSTYSHNEYSSTYTYNERYDNKTYS